MNNGQLGLAWRQQQSGVDKRVRVIKDNVVAALDPATKTSGATTMAALATVALTAAAALF